MPKSKLKLDDSVKSIHYGELIIVARERVVQGTSALYKRECVDTAVTLAYRHIEASSPKITIGEYRKLPGYIDVLQDVWNQAAQVILKQRAFSLKLDKQSKVKMKASEKHMARLTAQALKREAAEKALEKKYN